MSETDPKQQVKKKQQKEERTQQKKQIFVSNKEGAVSRTMEFSRQKNNSEKQKVVREELILVEEEPVELTVLTETSTEIDYKAQYDILWGRRKEFILLASELLREEEKKGKTETEEGEEKEDGHPLVKIVNLISKLQRPPRNPSKEKIVSIPVLAEINDVIVAIKKFESSQTPSIEINEEEKEEEEATTSTSEQREMPWAKLRKNEIIAWINKSGLRDDRLVEEKLKAHSGNFGWTNVKGAIGEFFAGQAVKSFAEDMTRKMGGEREVCSLVLVKLMTNERDENGVPTEYKSVHEIDNAILLKHGEQWIVETLCESKSDANSEASAAMQQLHTKLSGLKKRKVGEEVWRKEGDVLVENMTTKLTFKDTQRMSVGPVNNTGKGPEFGLSYPLEYSLDDLTDQLAIEWLDANVTKTLANIPLSGGGHKSALSKLL